MDTKTALGAAGGISLTVVGAVTALVLTFGGGTSILSGSPEVPSQPAVEYVDQYGNPVALEQPAPVGPEIVVTTADEQAADAQMVASDQPAGGEAYAEEGEEYEEEGEEEEEEYAAGEYEEDAEEYELEEADHDEDDEYGAGEHEEDDD